MVKVGYMASLFPCWSETFILREIQELEKQGAEIEIFSFKPASEKLVHPGAKPYLNRVFYPKKGKSAWALLKALIFHPIKFTTIVLKIVFSMLNKPVMMTKTLGLLPMALSFIPAIKKTQITHLHAHWATYPSTAAWIISEFTGIPYSFTSHAHDIWLEKPLLVEKIKKAKFVATISDYNKRYLNVFAGKVLDNVEIIHCGINLAEFAYEEPKLKPVPKLLAIGRFDEIKGFPYLVEACSILDKQGINFKLRILGDGPLREKLQVQIREKGIMHLVELPGAVSQDDVRKEIREATVFVAPSVQKSNGDQDGIPVVLMEAMAMGTPVISTYVSGIPELIKNEENGMIVESRDAEQLADALKRLIFSKKKQVNYSAAARNTIDESFNIRISVKHLLRNFQTR